MEYKLARRKGQKSIRMHFNDKGELIVSCPYFVGRKQIESFILSKSDWIRQQTSLLNFHTFQTGDVLPYFGKMLKLSVESSPVTKICVEEAGITVFSKTGDAEKIKRILKKFYSEKLYEFCQPRVGYWADKISVQKPELKITNSKSRWGVCYPSKQLVKISLISATLEPELLDFVVLHEVCHLVCCNHQKEFWALMEKAMPDIKEKNTRFRRFAKTGIHRNLF